MALPTPHHGSRATRVTSRQILCFGTAFGSPPWKRTALPRPDAPFSAPAPVSAPPPSNYRVSSRPTTYPIDFVVIHVTQETFPDAMKIFQDPARQVSVHYMVASADGYIGQFVREKDVAWHAGNKDYNNRSIGIEHEGWVDDPAWFTDEMYASSAALTAAVCDRFGIPKDRNHIIGHSEVPGADHTDPGPLWDWDRYLELVDQS